MDKSLILKQIKEHYKFKTDGEFANFLGIKQNSLSNWSTRNSIDYERIISKCEDIDANWLLTGKGSMLKNDDKSGVNQNVVGNGVTMVGGSIGGSVKSGGGGADDIIKELKKQLKDKDKEIERLKTQIDKLFKMIPL